MSIVDKLNFDGARRLPVLLQSELSECGLACVAMVCGYHKLDIDVPSLRKKFPVSLRGSGLKDLIHIFAQVNCNTRAIRTDVQGLASVKTPCVLHWDFNHFVVLKSFKNNKAVIHDPGQGKLVLDAEDVAKHFTGIVLEVAPSSDFTPEKLRSRLQLHHLWNNISGIWPSLIHIFVLALTLQVFALIAPYFIQLILDDVVLAHDTNLLHVLAIGFVLVYVLNAVCSGFRSWVILYLGATLNIQLVNNIFHHLIRLPLNFFSRRHTGDILSRFVSIDEVRKMITDGFIEAVIDGLMVTTSLIVMYLYSPKLMLIALLAVVLYTVLRAALYGPHRRAVEKSIVMGAKEETAFLETIRTIQTTKSFGKEGLRQSNWQNKYADKLNASINVGRLEIIYRAFHELMTGLEYVAIVWVGAAAIIDAELTAGMLVAFISYRLYFSNRAQALVDKLYEFKLLGMHLDRISDIVRESKEEGLYSDYQHFADFKGSIELKNIYFKYSSDERYILENVSLKLDAGKSLVITGASGSGKTTLLKIMMGLVKPESGTVLVDGVDIWKMGLANYRQLIASVMQDDTLISGSISDNISFFDPHVDTERVQACAVASALVEDILRMPMGFQTLIGDLGNTLSGGQQQRLLLARALYKNPLILFLDESTSHLDVDNEKKINTLVSQLGVTRIIIAHRAETIAMADERFDLVTGEQCINDQSAVA